MVAMVTYPPISLPSLIRVNFECTYVLCVTPLAVLYLKQDIWRNKYPYDCLWCHHSVIMADALMPKTQHPLLF